MIALARVSSVIYHVRLDALYTYLYSLRSQFPRRCNTIVAENATNLFWVLFALAHHALIHSAKTPFHTFTYLLALFLCVLTMRSLAKLNTCALSSIFTHRQVLFLLSFDNYFSRRALHLRCARFLSLSLSVIFLFLCTLSTTNWLWNFGIAFVVQSLEIRAVCSLRYNMIINKQRVLRGLSLRVIFSDSTDKLREIGQLEAIEWGRRRWISQAVCVRRETGETWTGWWTVSGELL